MDGHEDKLSTKEIFDLVADDIDNWRWTRFWRVNERPLLISMFQRAPSGDFCDVGCGTGTYLDLVGSGESMIFGVDISHHMLEIAHKKHGLHEAKLVQADVQQLPFEVGQFSKTLSTRVLSLVSDLKAGIQELARITKKDGMVLISDIHPAHPYERARISVSGLAYSLATYKHSIDSIVSTAEINNLQIDELKEVRLNDLIETPSRVEFSKLFECENPYIFYILRARKIGD